MTFDKLAALPSLDRLTGLYLSCDQLVTSLYDSLPPEIQTTNKYINLDKRRHPHFGLFKGFRVKIGRYLSFDF